MITISYNLRYSNKAKHLQLQLSSKGVEVIIPVKKKFSTSIIEEFIEKKRAWVERNWNRLHLSSPDLSDHALPTSIDLMAINQHWKVVYLPASKKKLTLFTNPDHQITLVGDIADKTACVKKLRSWLKNIAQQHLSEHIILASKQVNLPFNKVTIRNNTTRWGSCSSKKDINLCCKLLFLSPVLMRHILLHELCHTKVMHHGKAFWKLLSQLDPDAKENAKQLRLARIPLWVTKKEYTSP